jgi:hypothetical protein
VGVVAGRVGQAQGRGVAARLPKETARTRVLAGLGAAGKGILTARDATAAGWPRAASRSTSAGRWLVTTETQSWTGVVMSS